MRTCRASSTVFHWASLRPSALLHLPAVPAICMRAQGCPHRTTSFPRGNGLEVRWNTLAAIEPGYCAFAAHLDGGETAVGLRIMQASTCVPSLCACSNNIRNRSIPPNSALARLKSWPVFQLARPPSSPCSARYVFSPPVFAPSFLNEHATIGCSWFVHPFRRR